MKETSGRPPYVGIALLGIVLLGIGSIGLGDALRSARMPFGMPARPNDAVDAGRQERPRAARRPTFRGAGD